RPEERVTYCGSNPVSDLWCEKALALIAAWFRTAVRDGADLQARSNMMLAATFAGMGFGNAGVHIPHANGYPIAGMVKDYRPAGYPQQEPMVPHGQSVSLTAPEAFRFTFPTAPERHLRAAAMLAPGQETLNDPAEQLPSAVIALMRDIGIPSGIGAVGYTEADIGDLVPGTMKQQRLLATCARPVTEEDIAGIFAASIQNWCGGASAGGLRLPAATACTLIDQGHRPGRAAVGALELEREPGEGEPGVHHLVQVGEVLVVGDVLPAAHHVARVAGAGRVVRGRAVHPARLHLPTDDQ